MITLSFFFFFFFSVCVWILIEDDGKNTCMYIYSKHTILMSAHINIRLSAKNERDATTADVPTQHFSSGRGRSVMSSGSSMGSTPNRICAVSNANLTLCSFHGFRFLRTKLRTDGHAEYTIAQKALPLFNFVKSY